MQGLDKGALGQLEKFFLSGKQIGTAGMIALSEAVRSGALVSLQELDLHENQIGDEGMQAFPTAISSGALPKLAGLFVFGNPGSMAGVVEACSSRGIACYA